MNARSLESLALMLPAAVIAALEEVCARHGSTLRSTLARDRTPRVVRARHAAWAYLRGLLEEHSGLPIYSHSDICKMWVVDHTTVISGVKAHEARGKHRS